MPKSILISIPNDAIMGFDARFFATIQGRGEYISRSITWVQASLCT
ncbi:MAG TPA: hypothetical protein VLD65_04385 [Anaerolineales bacterium]|nr:hypothetical protein [Anaerolineales bacterium]